MNRRTMLKNSAGLAALSIFGLPKGILAGKTDVDKVFETFNKLVKHNASYTGDVNLYLEDDGKVVSQTFCSICYYKDRNALVVSDQLRNLRESVKYNIGSVQMCFSSSLKGF